MKPLQRQKINEYASFRPYSGSAAEEINSKISGKLSRYFQERLIKKSTEGFDLLDVVPFLCDGIESLKDDKFTNCFLSSESIPWNWNFYLYPIWIIGIVVRYLILFPLRLTFLLVCFILFFLYYFLIDLFLYTISAKRKLELKRKGITFLATGFVLSWTGVIRYHGIRPKHKPNQVFVANHTTVFDICVLLQDMDLSIVGQAHPGVLGFMEKTVLECMECIWFERSLVYEREKATETIRSRIQKNGINLLVFPEGTCVNNEYCVMFKKGVFELDAEICPVAIRYNKVFCDPFWNSQRESFVRHLFRLMASWALVADIYYLEPTSINPGEKPSEFASRVKARIAHKARLVNVPWDGYLKYFRPNDSFKQELQKVYSNSLSKFCSSMNEEEDDKYIGSSKEGSNLHRRNV